MPMAHDITYDSAYKTVHRDDFDALIEVDRYGNRSDAFDSIISATVDHLWDPQDTRYIDCQDAPLPYAERLRHDIFERTETAMAQSHCFEVCELALRAQAQATRLA